MANQYAQEFTPELSSDYLQSLLNPINEEERQNVGAARREGAAGGLAGTAAEGSRIGQAIFGGEQQKQSAVSKFNIDVAQAKRGERLTSEDEAFKDTERQKQEAFQRSLTEMGYAHEDAIAAGQKHAAEQGAIFGGITSLASAGIGGYFGGLGKAAGAAAGAAGSAAGSYEASKSEDEFDPYAGHAPTYSSRFQGEGF